MRFDCIELILLHFFNLAIMQLSEVYVTTQLVDLIEKKWSRADFLKIKVYFGAEI